MSKEGPKDWGLLFANATALGYFNQRKNIPA